MPEEKNPVDQVLDLLVFAPLGLAATARTQLPEMVAKGRSQVESQVAMARFIGQFAVQQGKVEVEKRLKAYSAPRSAPAQDPPTASPPGTARVEPAGSGGRAEPAGSEGTAEPAGSGGRAERVAEGGPPPAAGELAIPGYDALSASQVVQRLAGLSIPELELVRRYEAATRGRKTVLTKISQLQ